MRNANKEKQNSTRSADDGRAVSAKDKNNNTNAGLFFLIFFGVIILIIGSLFWQVQSEQKAQKSFIYNGFEFVPAPSGEDETLWITQIEVKNQLYNVPFYYHPSATEEVFMKEGLAESIVDAAIKPDLVYFSLDPDAGSRPVIAAVELSRLFGKKYNLLNMDVRSALSSPVNGTDLAVITCEDAVDGVLVIDFRIGPINQVYNEGNCVHIEYTSAQESIRVADRFAFELLKIM